MRVRAHCLTSTSFLIYQPHFKQPHTHFPHLETFPLFENKYFFNLSLTDYTAGKPDSAFTFHVSGFSQIFLRPTYVANRRSTYLHFTSQQLGPWRC